jgi:predicted nucleotidyltransferase
MLRKLLDCVLSGAFVSVENPLRYVGYLIRESIENNRSMKKQVKELLNAVVSWAEAKPDILGVALVGSYARGKAKIDSDVDLVFLTLNPKVLIDKPEWINEFGDAKSLKVEDWGLVTSLRVFYQEDFEVEYGITTLEWAREPLDEGTCQVIADGLKVLLDKSGFLERALKYVSSEGSR